MSDETLLETLKKASSAIYIVTDEETANHISILFRRAGSEIATLQSELAERWENLNVQDGVIAKQQEEIAALKSKVEMLETIECKYIEEIQEYAALKEEG